MNETKMRNHIESTRDHASEVRKNIAIIIYLLSERQVMHDNSKLVEQPEAGAWAAALPRLSGLTYGSAEYKAELANLKDILKHHYACNRHHPEHFDRGIRGMTLVDLVEMFCDWMASVKRHKDGDIYRSIRLNKRRFEFTDDIAAILVNTAKEVFNA